MGVTSARRCLLCLYEMLDPDLAPWIYVQVLLKLGWKRSCETQEPRHAALCPVMKCNPKERRAMFSPLLPRTECGSAQGCEWGLRHQVGLGSRSQQAFGRSPRVIPGNTSSRGAQQWIWRAGTAQGPEPKNRSKTPGTHSDKWLRFWVMGEGPGQWNVRSDSAFDLICTHKLAMPGSICVANRHTPALITLHYNPQFT